MDLKIVGWTDYDSRYPSVAISDDEVTELMLIVAREVIKCGYMFSGEQHQSSATGVPVFQNGTCFRASMRAWGTIMAGAYASIDEQETNYMDFYMSTPKKETLPPMKELDVLPAESDNFNGMITPQDSEMISQSIQMGIPFMTTDKALNHIMDEIKKALDSYNNEDQDNSEE